MTPEKHIELAEEYLEHSSDPSVAHAAIAIAYYLSRIADAINGVRVEVMRVEVTRD